jgi:hypothetical protein
MIAVFYTNRVDSCQDISVVLAPCFVTFIISTAQHGAGCPAAELYIFFSAANMAGNQLLLSPNTKYHLR